jgi:FkbM family methyltransferase
MFYRIIRKLLAPHYGKKKYQPLFESLYKLSLAGMNIGGGTNVTDSGELSVVHYIRERLLSSKRNKGCVIFDVGANIGEYSLLLNDVFGTGTEIHSFEPSAKTFKKLVENLHSKIKGYQQNFGLGENDYSTTLFSDHDESGLASVYKRKLDHYHIDMNQTETIEIRKLDSYCLERNIAHIHFLKLDVEGHEKKVLDGAKDMLDGGKIDFIQFEFGGTDIDSRTFFRDFYYLLADQYRIYRIVKDGIYPVFGYGEFYESFLATNYLAERKSFV